MVALQLTPQNPKKQKTVSLQNEIIKKMQLTYNATNLQYAVK